MLGLILDNPAEEPSDELEDDAPQKDLDELFYTPATLGTTVLYIYCFYWY